jgi:hypothetical protein
MLWISAFKKDERLTLMQNLGSTTRENYVHIPSKQSSTHYNYFHMFIQV